MKRGVLIIIMVVAGFCSGMVQGQTKNQVVESGSSINIPTGKVNKMFIAPKEQNHLLKSAQSNKIEIEVTYINFPSEARQAFEYAVSIWENLLTSTVPVKIQATWESFDNGALALGRPSTFHVNFNGAQVTDTYYPVALAEKLAGENINADEADILCRFNSNYPWYFGTDGNTPSSKYDFVSAVLHEIVHGLGFSGFFEDNGQSGYYSNSNNLPSIYDYYLFNNQNQQLSDASVFHVPSHDLHNQLTSDALKFYSPDAAGGYEQTTDWIFAPKTWSQGASIYHLEQGSGLMDAYMHQGEAIHAPEETTLEILAEMGWKSVVFDFDGLNDIEEPCAEIPVEVGFFSDFNISQSEMKVIFSKDYFISADSVGFQYNAATKKFTGVLPLDFFQGNLQYYFKLETTGGKLFKHPSTAPARKFSLRIGPDYSAPTVVHNPVKMISKSEPVIHLSAEAHDNIGINSVKIEYKVNGVLQEPFVLENEEKDIYKGVLELKNQTLSSDKLEYRIVAEDKSSRGNKRAVPSSGFYAVNLFQAETAVHSYVTDFENSASDFITAEFSVSPVPGFASSILHSRHPYPVSAIENEKYNLIAQLKTPVVLHEGGLMSFDEVVLVEPGQPETTWNEEMFWDYVIVEGSKDGGKTWYPLTDGYDSGYDVTWKNTFESSWINNTSNANGNESLFRNHTIDLTNNPEFNPGDTLIFRFRLASDKSVSGWGWAIDNLEIQKGFTTGSEMVAEAEISVYPNPFSNSFYVDCSDMQDSQTLEIIVTDLLGKTVYHETGIDVFYASKKQVDLAGNQPGIYLVNIRDENKIVANHKIIKN
jgi:hypothetical protein